MRLYQPISRTFRRTICLSVTAIVTMLAGVDAAELNPAQIPTDAKWLIHINQEKLSDLKVVETLRDEYPKIDNAIRQWFKNRYGIDLQVDLQSLTMFSRDYRAHTGTVLLQTEYDEENIKTLLRKSDLSKKRDGLKQTTWKGHTLYTVTLAKHDHQHEHGETSSDGEDHDHSGGKEMTVYFGKGLVVLASSVPNAKSYLRLLEGNAPSLKGTESRLIDEAPAGAVIYGAAIKLGRLDRYKMLMPLLQQQEQCVYAFGQRDDKLFETLTLTAQSEEVAKETTEVLEGLIAYERLCAAGSKPLTRLMNNVELTPSGTRARVTWEGDSELVVAAVRDSGQRVDQWMKVLEIPRWHSGEEQSHQVDLASQEQPRERRMARRAWLGAMIRAAGGMGVEIARIYLDSPAEKAGLKAGDRITQIDGTDVSSPQVVTQQIAKLEPGTKIDIVAERDGEELAVEVEVGNLEDFHERLFGKRFRQKFDDFHKMFDPDFDGVPEGVFSFRIPMGDDDEVTLRELLREMREELRQFRQEFRESTGNERDSSNEKGAEASPEG
ncbi:MAG: PDZ domain-containing protein [Pirellulaceae bacterium]